MDTWLIVVLAILVLAVLSAVKIYNRLVGLRNRFRNAFAQIDVQLKRRYDLIPNLVETAKSYLKHERETLEAVIAARNQAAEASGKAAQAPGDPGAMKELSGAESGLAGALSRLMVVVERYPDLKADRTVAQMMEELTFTENRVSFARQAFNDAVMKYNTSIEVFPAVAVANMFGFKKAEFFEISVPEEREAPRVSFA